MKFLFSILFYFTIVILNLPKDCFSQKVDSAYHHDYVRDRVINRFTEKQWGISGSINAGKYVTGTIGITHAVSEQGFEIWSLSAIGLNAEIIDPKRSAYGFGAEAWFNAYISMGLAAVDYTDLINSRYCVRPMLGVGFGNWRFVYGYNIRLNKNDYRLFNTNMIMLNYFFPVSHHKIGIVDRKM